MNECGFIIIRNVYSELTNLYWVECIKLIRKNYKDIPIIIIDDNSNYDYIKIIDDEILNNCKIIQSEYKGCREFLGYYYLYKNKFFRKSVIINDSTFIQKKININNIDEIKILWTLKTNNILDPSNLIELLDNNEEIFNLYKNKDQWKGCFYSMTIIDINFLNKIQDKYNILRLKDYLISEKDLFNFELLLGLVIYINITNKEDISLLGEINNNYFYPYYKYICVKNNKTYIKEKIIKINNYQNDYYT